MVYLSSEQRRARIIDAAVHILAEEGFGGLTTRNIAQRADTPLGSLHYCFRDKDELVDLVGDRTVALMQEALSAVPDDLGVEATIRTRVDALWQWLRKNYQLMLAVQEVAMRLVRRGGKPKDVYAIWGSAADELFTAPIAAAAARERVALGVPASELGRFILHRFDGMAIEYIASRDNKACARQAELLADAAVRLALG